MDNPDSKPQQTGGLKLMTVFIAVLALHVLVIGGFTVYHLMSSGGDADLAIDKTHKLKADGTVVTDTATPDSASPDKTADATASTETPTTPSATAPTGTSTAATGSATTAEPSTPATDTATPTAAPTAVPATSPAPTQVAATTPAATAPATTGSKPGSPIVLSGDDMGQASTIPAQLLPPPDEPAAPIVPAAHPATTPSAPAVAMIHDASGPIALTSKDGVEPMTAPAPLASTNTPSGPVKPATASGPVHMPVTSPAPSATTNVASHTEHATAPAHEKAAVATTHETKKQTYTVKMTDTYKNIAESHHITVAELKAANHIKADAPMKTGQKLIIPSDKTSVAKSSATHDTVASESASTASLSATPASAAKSHKHYYTVTKGDTLKYIAKKFNVTPSALEQANNLSGTKLAVGEKLRIPSHEAHATASTATSSAQVTDRVLAPVPAPAAIQPSQVETQPAPVEQPSSTPVATPALEPQPTPASNPELTSLNF